MMVQSNKAKSIAHLKFFTLYFGVKKGIIAFPIIDKLGDLTKNW